ncbi:peptidoglycan L-alanyl-D-glutamate endopeptidase CwlK [Paenibacillus cellulosilyticus]|uniref:Peptidoglycan L-alanyl-D-glutamate endopeptidase CwlK n=1 Tax=Paenibacillus cellulosilyticus TaxID=375489 RepID=A0A2V2Z414_9BACL|nr:M15 family metallopeptidase [Paenibacillus cellulosilyticus]PWW05075.1 peptidoglycan L-alanyl-D-glutamate endopeptidase CwlK [Paenibacillus cellulosilyticus]QKS48628.1 M15 family metallopeptidase [Paenibacillus cellulosilyticus]
MQQMKQSSDYTAPVRSRVRSSHTYPWPRINLLVLIALALLVAAAVWLYRQGPSEELPPPTELHPAVAQAIDQLVDEASKLGIEVVITDGFRSSAEQDALYRQGREDSGVVVTQVKGGESYHNYGLAIDFALRTPSNDVIWDMGYDGNGNGRADWMEVVDIAKKLGFTWGGDWEGFKDNPHLQMDFGYSIRQLKNGHYPSMSAEEEA